MTGNIRRAAARRPRGHSGRRLAALALAGALLCGGIARAGFPTFDVAAFGQRVQGAINANAQLAAVASIVQNTLTMIARIETQIDHAEGAIGALANWQQHFPAIAALGTASDIASFQARAASTLQRAQSLTASALELPAAADVRSAWALRPADTPLGPPVLPPPPTTRADRSAAARDAAQAAADARGQAYRERGEAYRRAAQKVEETAGKLSGIASDTVKSAAGLGQKQLSAAASLADLTGLLVQLELQREQQEIAREAAEREAVRDLHAAALDAVEATFTAHAQIMARFDAAGADAAVSTTVLPTY